MPLGIGIAVAVAVEVGGFHFYPGGRAERGRI